MFHWSPSPFRGGFRLNHQSLDHRHRLGLRIAEALAVKLVELRRHVRTDIKLDRRIAPRQAESSTAVSEDRGAVDPLAADQVNALLLDFMK